MQKLFFGLILFVLLITCPYAIEVYPICAAGVYAGCAATAWFYPACVAAGLAGCVLACYDSQTYLTTNTFGLITHTRITDIQEGQHVLTLEGDKPIWTRVTKVIQTGGSHSFVNIAFGESSSYLRVTPGHGIIVIKANGEKYIRQAGSLKVGDILLNEKGHQVTVKSVRFEHDTLRFTVHTEAGTVLANGIFTSIMCGTDLKEQEDVHFASKIEDWQARHPKSLKYKDIADESGIPAIVTYTKDSFDMLNFQRKPALLLVGNNSNQELSQLLHRIVAKTKSPLMFIDIPNLHDIHSQGFAFLFQLQPSELPAIVIYDSQDLQKYKFSGPLTEEKISTFISDFEKKNLKPFYRSASEPTVQEKGAQILVGTNYKSVVTKDKDIFVLHYAPWSEDSKKILDQWDQLAHELAQVSSDIVLAKFDIGYNEVEGVSTYNYPSIQYYPRAAKDRLKPVHYEGGFDVTSIKNWMNVYSSILDKGGKYPTKEDF